MNFVNYHYLDGLLTVIDFLPIHLRCMISKIDFAALSNPPPSSCPFSKWIERRKFGTPGGGEGNERHSSSWSRFECSWFAGAGNPETSSRVIWEEGENLCGVILSSRGRAPGTSIFENNGFPFSYQRCKIVRGNRHIALYV